MRSPISGDSHAPRVNEDHVNETPWHGLGNQLTPNQPLEVWAKQAGMDWTIESSEVRYVSGNGSLGSIHAFPDQKVL